MGTAMAGQNQHHIPQFLQRGFGVPRSGKPKEIWKYQKGVEPQLSEIKRTAAEDWFYSPPPEDGAKTLDDQITDRETPLARKVAALRQTQAGSAVDTAVAAEVLLHLAPRTSHLRATFTHALTGLVQGIREIFTDGDNLKALLGLDSDQPSERFRGQAANELETNPLLAQLGLPPAVLERVAFWIAKENFHQLVEQLPQFRVVLDSLAQAAPKTARDGHIKAITKILVEGGERDDLLRYRWTAQAAPAGGAILPDCIAFAVLNGGEPRPFIGAASGDVHAIVLPLAGDKLLVGTKESARSLALDDVNVAAAGCCYDFFLAATDEHRALIGEIGKFATTDIEKGLTNATQEFRIERDPTPLIRKLDVEGADQTDEKPASGNFSYQVSCLDFGDQELVGRIAEVVKYIVGELAHVIPLDRLDGITFAADYQAGLRAVDRGVPNLPPPESVSEDIGVGAAMTLPVKRGGVIKARIVMAGIVGLGLVEKADTFEKLALHTLVQELAQVSMVQLLDEALPGVILSPIADAYEGRLFVSVHSALDSYAASRVSSSFGDSDEIMHASQELLVSTLGLAQQRIPEARFAYRFDGDLPKLVALARPLIEHILGLSAKLVGHADGLRRSPFDSDDRLKGALQLAGLLNWFNVFQADLRTFWDRRGRWESLSELFRFNRHVERIYWQFGMFWSRGEDGDPHIHIPTMIDAVRLFEATTRGAQVPGIPSAP
jgi:hypothetical protein